MSSLNRKIAFFTSGHSPFSSRLFHKELKSIKNEFNNLYIIAPHEKKEQIVDDIKIIGIPKYRHRYKRYKTHKELFKKAINLAPDLLHCHEPDSMFIAYLVKQKLKHIKIIYDCHEFHPESFTEKFPLLIRYPIRHFVNQIECRLATKADAVITVNDKLVKKFKKYSNLVTLLPNYPLKRLFADQYETTHRQSGSGIRLIYVGGLSPDRGLTTVVELINKLKKVHNVRLILVGKFPSKIYKHDFEKKLASDNLYGQVEYKGQLSHQQAIAEMMNADIGLCILKGKKRYHWSEPTKYFEYSAAGLPVIANNLEYTRRLIKKNQNGIIISNNTSVDTINKISNFISESEKLKMMSENGKIAFNNEYNWEKIEPSLINLYCQLLSCS